MKPISFHEFKNLKRKTLNDFNRWMEAYYKRAVEHGLNIGSAWTEDEVFHILRSEGIGVERANRIVDKLLERENDADAELIIRPVGGDQNDP